MKALSSAFKKLAKILEYILLQMNYWVNKVINRYCDDFGYQSICEIGSSRGEATDKLLISGGRKLTVIDPCLDADLCGKYENSKRVTICKGLSLEFIPKLPEVFDCIMIDGDHNWFTVFNELKEIERRQLLRNGGTVFFHDVGWPYGRRDLYYQPDQIPSAFRHCYARKGMIHGRSELVSNGGRNSALCNAVIEGGERNGVLTAIEDFIKQACEEYLFFKFNEEDGLGVLVKKNGIKSNMLMAKWRFLCKMWNLFDGSKKAVRQRLPNLYEAVRRGARKSLK